MATDRRIDPAIEYFESNRTRQTFRIESEKERYERERSSMRKCSISRKNHPRKKGNAADAASGS